MKKFRKICLKLITLAILIPTFINLYIIAYASPYIYSIDELDDVPYKYTAISLGAKVFSGGSLSHILNDRVNVAVTLYDNKKVERILFSGDHGQDEYDEVNAMMDSAITQGIPKSDIFLDHAGFSTYESMVRASKIFECDDVVIVTQRFHLYRAIYIARRMDLDAIGVCADLTNYRKKTDIKNITREFFARVKEFFYVEILRPDPTYLGDVIPITGDADLTHDKN